MKGILIIGPQGSGKTRKAKEIAEAYADDTVVWTNQSDISHLQFNEKTELIILDEFTGKPLELVDWTYVVKSGLLPWSNKEVRPVRIKPKVVIITNAITEGLLGRMTLECFDVIECTRKEDQQ